ncbi:50S ribosomal protein L31 [Candidatus Phytoplasma melaleucae]|uniref:50S ribosomal protein L31 n=1 Tax=Candidatus Phytoplasma melaleucae TaxID=2982630 RepID=A0ABT9DD41_9MOLU|nr:50S ribosomal protein L31 ['Melaleuca sp.' phytoplasma]MDO8168012.1 50S ribosomal protein L31 ['Melaleuca sp.' phytoplasma]MDV3205449.1 50S ribosomal protein L31 [Weeping tea tree witches'-broom phytoplasma]
MKNKSKQPDFYEIEVSCATCKKKHKIGTTVKTIKVESCSNCHPFYTNSQSFVTVAGRVDKFYKRYGNN